MSATPHRLAQGHQNLVVKKDEADFAEQGQGPFIMTRLKYGYISSQNLDKATHFYSHVLGLSLKFRDGNRWAQFAAGGADFAIASPEEAAADSVIVFEVEDLEAAAIRVGEAGGKITALRDMGGHGKVLAVQDPDGNVLQLFSKA